MNPVGKPRMTRQDRWKKRPAVVKYWEYCDDLRAWLGENYELPGELYIDFYLPMPKSWPKKQKEQLAGKPHLQKPDIDNLAKGFMDAFKKEDKHVYKLIAAKYWAYEGSITLKEVEYEQRN